MRNVMSFGYLNVFKPIEHTKDYHIRKPNDENFLFEIEDKKYIYVGGKVFTFETNDTILNYSSELGFNDINFPYAYAGENIYLLLHRKCIPIREYKTSTEKDEYEYIYPKDTELKVNGNEGNIEAGNDFKNCKIISNKNSTIVIVY